MPLWPFRLKTGPSAPAWPRHIAIIMDGNGRWAQRRGLPRSAGHKAGAENFRRIATYCQKHGLSYLTIYAFSTENWNRPAGEVDTIMSLLHTYLLEAREKMLRENISLRILGDSSRLPAAMRELIRETDALSEQTTGLKVGVCLNYGGRDEILHAARRLAREAAAGRLSPEDITAERFAQGLWTAGIPDPDLVIRPGAERRTSNFLLWQSAYAEYYFSDLLWPDFNEEALDRAVAWYAGRRRRFGGL